MVVSPYEICDELVVFITKYSGQMKESVQRGFFMIHLVDCFHDLYMFACRIKVKYITAALLFFSNFLKSSLNDKI